MRIDTFNICHKMGFWARRPCKKPLISQVNKRKRLGFYHRHKNWAVNNGKILSSRMNLNLIFLIRMGEQRFGERKVNVVYHNALIKQLYIIHLVNKFQVVITYKCKVIHKEFIYSNQIGSFLITWTLFPDYLQFIFILHQIQLIHINYNILSILATNFSLL